MRASVKKVLALLPPPPWKYKGTLSTCVVALALFVFAAIYGGHGLMDLLQLRGEQRQLEHAAFQLQQRNEQLRERVRLLQTDDRYIEKLARERLGLVKKGELVYRILPPPRAPVPSQ